jgi:hypothetical protein
MKKQTFKLKVSQGSKQKLSAGKSSERAVAASTDGGKITLKGRRQ